MMSTVSYESFKAIHDENSKLKTQSTDLLEALEKIADTSPNWMRKDAVADSERRMRQIATEAIHKAKESE